MERIVPGGLLAMKGLVALQFALSIPVAYWLARRTLPTGAALGVALLSLTNPYLIEFSHHIMSEIPYLLFSLAALLAVDRALRTGRLRPAIVSAILVASAILIKPVGLALGAGLILALRLQGQRRAAIAVGSGCLAAVLLTAALGGPFALTSSARSDELDIHNPEFQSYVSRIFERDAYQQVTERASLGDLAGRAARNLWGYVSTNLPLVLMPFPALLFEQVWTSPSGRLILILLTLCGLSLGLARSLRLHRPEAWYLVVYLAGLLLWPSRGVDLGPGRRYLVPLLPIMLIFLINGLQRLLRLIGGTSHRLQPIGTAVLVAAMSLLYLFTARDITRGERHYPPSWSGYYEAAAWLKRHAPPDAVILARKPFDLYLEAERRTAYYPYSPDPGDLVRAIERYQAAYVVIDSLGRQETPRYLVPAINANKERFAIAFASSIEPRTYVLRTMDRSGVRRR
ncbi:MAG: DUF2079 domain-containing protein [candidate division NC10 bacterium]|nr:DUF2079 domain-containing protein [candidate division NC10 bacterium]